MKIKSIKPITEDEYQFYAIEIGRLLQSGFKLASHEVFRLGITFNDVVPTVSIAEKINVSISGKVNNEDYFFTPAVNKKEHLIQYDLSELKDLKNINAIVNEIVDKVLQSVYAVNQQQAEKKKQEEQEKKEAERVKEIFDYSRKRRIERINQMIEIASEGELDKLYMAAKIILRSKN